MYIVKFKKTGRTLFNGEVFFTYERARQAARKHARKLLKKDPALRDKGMFGLWDDVSRNPGQLNKVYRIINVDPNA